MKYTLAFFLSIFLFGFNFIFPTKFMKVRSGQLAPNFVTSDATGKTFRLDDFKGKKVFLSFFRSAGCPTCNVRFHELEGQEALFKSKGLVFVAVYASQPQNLANFIAYAYPTQAPYPVFIADPTEKLYQQYGITRSLRALTSGLLFHGGFAKFNKGKALFKSAHATVKDDVSPTLQTAEFLIDETGKVVQAHYPNYAGDFMPMTVIRSFLSN